MSTPERARALARRRTVRWPARPVALLGRHLGEAGGQGDGPVYSPLAADLGRALVLLDDAQAGQETFAGLPREEGGESAGGSVGGALTQFDAHGQMPQHGSHHRTGERAHGSADRTRLGVGRDGLYRGDHPDQDTR